MVWEGRHHQLRSGGFRFKAALSSLSFRCRCRAEGFCETSGVVWWPRTKEHPDQSEILNPKPTLFQCLAGLGFRRQRPQQQLCGPGQVAAAVPWAGCPHGEGSKVFKLLRSGCKLDFSRVGSTRSAIEFIIELLWCNSRGRIALLWHSSVAV